MSVSFVYDLEHMRVLINVFVTSQIVTSKVGDNYGDPIVYRLWLGKNFWTVQISGLRKEYSVLT